MTLPRYMTLHTELAADPSGTMGATAFFFRIRGSAGATTRMARSVSAPRPPAEPWCSSRLDSLLYTNQRNKHRRRHVNAHTLLRATAITNRRDSDDTVSELVDNAMMTTMAPS